MSKADEMFEELGYEIIDLHDGRIHYSHKKKDKEFTFMCNNCYSVKRPTKQEQIAINLKCQELGY